MNKIVKLILAYEKATEKLLEAFNVDLNTFLIYNYISERWYLDGTEITFLDECGCEYSNDGQDQLMSKVDGFYLFLCYDNGEQFYAIFNEDMRFEEFEEFEAEIGKKI